MLEKMCRTCRQVKPLSAFYRESASPDGRRYVCKACCSRKDRKRRIANGQPVRAHKPWMIGCDRCDYINDCNVLVKKRGEDPYCFKSNPNHETWLRNMGLDVCATDTNRAQNAHERNA